MGSSRSGLTTKIHVLGDAEGRPVRLELTAGRVAAATLLENLAPGATLLAIRVLATARGASGNTPPRVVRKSSFAFSASVYRRRNLVERFFNRIKQFRGLTTRYDRNPENYLAALKLAAVRIWLAVI